MPTYGGPYSYDRCPNHYMRSPDPWRDAVVDVWRDWKQGVVVDWPDRYTAAVVEAVRLIDWEHGKAVASAERRQWAEQERRRKAGV